MTVGIITYHNACSYGAHLQAYALQEAIRSINHNPMIIDYKGVGFTPAGMKDFKKVLRKPWQVIESYNQYVMKKKMASFSSFQNRTCHYSSYRELMSSPPEFDAYICGSDQIWQPKLLLDGRIVQDEFFLSFVQRGKRKISYAPSFGTIPNDEYVRRITPLLMSFDNISVREESMVGIIRRAVGVSPQIVCDPTILVGKEVFENLLPLRSEQNQGAFFFPLTINQSRDPKICKEVQKRYKRLRIVGRGRRFLFIGENYIPSPIEWMASIRDADFVLTNSFHGTVFSILFHKPFITLNWANDLQNIRVKNLLERVGLESRFYSNEEVSGFFDVADAEIDWCSVDEKLETWRKQSFEFLKKALI